MGSNTRAYFSYFSTVPYRCIYVLYIISTVRYHCRYVCCTVHVRSRLVIPVPVYRIIPINILFIYLIREFSLDDYFNILPIA